MSDLALEAQRLREADLLTDDPEAQPCQRPPIIEFQPYHIGGGRHRPHWAHRFHVDRWFRSWQCEWTLHYGIVMDNCMHACRAWTRAGTLRKARRWYRNGTDVKRVRRGRERGEK